MEAVEIVSLAGGLALLNGPLDAPQAGVAWVSFVVGVHFIALAAACGWWGARQANAAGQATRSFRAG